MQQHIFDHPNARSNHTLPTPRGGGIAVFLSILVGIALLPFSPSHTFFTILVGGSVLALISFLDDRQSVPIRLRLLVQLGAVILGMFALGKEILVFQGLFPFWLDRVIAGFIWLWFVNLYNFMDGIDGITGMETVCVMVGIALIASMTSGGMEGYGHIAMVVAAAAVGFLVWNWHPARIFIGDVGSIPLGYILGFFLLMLAGTGYWAAALLLPAYYLADSGITLLKRILRKEKFWQAHSQHFYQKAVRGGLKPPEVVGRILLGNGALLALAIYSLHTPVLSLFLGVLITLLLLYWLCPHEQSN